MHRLAPTLLLALNLAVAAPAPPLAAEPAGQQARLRLELRVQGGPGHPGLQREATLELPMVSDETAAMHLLMDGPDEGMQAWIAHRQGISQLGAEALQRTQQLEGLDFAACERDEQSPACRQALARLQAWSDDMERTRARIDQHEAAAPPAGTPHRYQIWRTQPERGCGRAQFLWRDARQTPQTLRLPVDDSLNARLQLCGSLLVLDRQAGRAQLAFTPLNVRAPSPPGSRRLDFLDTVWLEAPSITVDGFSNSLRLPPLSATVTASRWQGEHQYRSDAGALVQLRWQLLREATPLTP